MRGVYQIRNTETGKLYIGSSVNVARRLYMHRRMLVAGTHHSIALQRAWDKHGAEAFDFSLLKEVPEGDLLAAEQACIDAAQSFGDGGYNMCPVAGTRAGSKQPLTVAAKLSAERKGVPKSPEHRAKIAAAMSGRRKTVEHRAKLAEASRRVMTDPERREHLARIQTGRTMPREAVERMAAALRGRPAHPNTRAALIESNRRRGHKSAAAAA